MNLPNVDISYDSTKNSHNIETEWREICRNITPEL